MTSSIDSLSQGQSFSSGQLKAVDVAGIENQLKDLWKQASQSGHGADPVALIRACSLNLIIFSADDNAESQGSDLLDEILVHHPARGILAIFRPQKPANLSAWVSARCHVAGTSKQICSEQITVCSEGGHIRQLSSVVLPLVLPDLPVFLWWRHKRLDHQLYGVLHNCARRLIIDSGRADSDLSILREAAALIADQRGCLAVSDLNWRRLMPWLESFADAFDGFPMAVTDLSKISRLVFWHASLDTASVASQSVLFVAWLASRLGWIPSTFAMTQSGCLVTFTANEETIAVELLSMASADVQPGQIVKVQCDFSDKQTMTATIEHNKEFSFIVAKSDRSDLSEATRIDTAVSETALVGQEVEVLNNDAIYEQAMAMALQLLEKQEKR